MNWEEMKKVAANRQSVDVKWGKFNQMCMVNWEKIEAIVDAAKKTIGLSCQSGNHHESCRVCNLQKALKALEQE